MNYGPNLIPKLLPASTSYLPHFMNFLRNGAAEQLRREIKADLQHPGQLKCTDGGKTQEFGRSFLSFFI